MWIEKSQSPEGEEYSEDMKLIEMKRLTTGKEWLNNKYGEQVPMWQVQLPFDNKSGNAEGQFKLSQNTKIFYSYVKTNQTRGSISERQPKRQLSINNPKGYEGTLTPKTPEFEIVDRINVVNGTVNKADGTFLEGFFFNEIGESNKSFNIILGPYPLYQVDVEKMAQDGRVTAVLSLQNNYEKEQRGLDQAQIQAWYKQSNMEFVSKPVNDLAGEDRYLDDLWEACETLHRLLDRKHRVYLHCTAGQSRNTTLAICYLCLYIQTHHWSQPKGLLHHFNQMHPGSSPNMRIVNAFLIRHADLQKKILDQMNRANREDEFERARLERIRIDQEKQLWQRREDYLRRERRFTQQEALKRRQREENERKRLLKLENERIMDLEEALRQMNEDEIEQIRLLRAQVREDSIFEHFYLGDHELNTLHHNVILNLCE